ncbi:transglycosylase family protein [Streptomyces sp. NBC_01754]|uniref:transglycosylase family protein n=1 Tax=Streptomyces sp. NBC_01754 TaxID=2975930 RepID=UPI002DD93145|nr:transglycosylase family protein [Streptomyces sp. NBC_01754]WSC92883.1 transglycosylase family protein [Streptomyces sp. NBC_01754]
MGSANGRHRRPRQAPAIVVTAGVTGSAIAIPLLGATGAHAADASTWDRVAECESGGMWSADLGNGSYGGLQFSQDTWKAYGGTAYAPRADLASRSQQIAVAEKVLDAKGPQAWPSCAGISGLLVDGALPGVDPGGDPAADATATPSPEAVDGTSGEAADGGRGEAADGNKGRAADKASDDAPGAPDTGSRGGGSDTPDEARGSAGRDGAGPSASPSATPSPGATGTPGAPQGTPGGKHRGAPAPEAGATGAEEADGRESGRHASRGDSGAREGAGTASDGTYTVQEGDNLWAIAEAQSLPGGWTGLYEANKDEVGSDPDLILPGQSLDLTQPADTGSALAQGGATTTVN